MATAESAAVAATGRARHTSDSFAARLLDWYELTGRHDLPWQHPRSPYRVWIAEIMLQQTQVATVIPFFERFMARFPALPTLAGATLDEVLAMWSGLGYYARARNLHAAARAVTERFGGELPTQIDELVSLPGIGRSTAGAILAQAHGQRHPILDGNAKRVLARFHGIEGWPGESRVERALWAAAEQHTPQERVADYTQAIMDLGATLCVRVRPACGVCPVARDCAARERGIQASVPGPRPKRAKPRKRSTVLMILDGDGCVLLERRPPSGIWGGLFSLPEVDSEADARGWCASRLGAAVTEPRRIAAVRHAFTHFDLDIEPLQLRLEDSSCRAVADADNLLWYDPNSSAQVGIAAPIAALLRTLRRRQERT